MVAWCGTVFRPKALGPAKKPAPRPNIILILADDFGYECVGANGGTSYMTPHLDKLAACASSTATFNRCVRPRAPNS